MTIHAPLHPTPDANAFAALSLHPDLLAGVAALGFARDAGVVTADRRIVDHQGGHLVATDDRRVVLERVRLPRTDASERLLSLATPQPELIALKRVVCVSIQLA